MSLDRKLLVVAAIFSIIAGLGLYSAGRICWALLRRRRLERGQVRTLTAFLVPGALLAAMGVWGAVEPSFPETTFTTLRLPGLPRGARLRIVHITDTHADERTPLVSRLPGLVNPLAPDVVIHTGDAVNSEAGVLLLQEAIAKLHPRLGTYFVRGNQDEWFWEGRDLYGPSSTELKGRPVEVGGVTLCGAAWGLHAKVGDCLRTTTGPRVIVLHSPDLVEELAPLGADLYLAGHTHGGQVRIPLYGAYITLSRFGKKYEMGRYQVGRTTLYVNRGIGFENPPVPAVRVLCRPEIAVIDLVGE